jgi:hypothetical protein
MSYRPQVTAWTRLKPTCDIVSRDLVRIAGAERNRMPLYWFGKSTVYSGRQYTVMSCPRSASWLYRPSQTLSIPL